MSRQILADQQGGYSSVLYRRTDRRMSKRLRYKCARTSYCADFLARRIVKLAITADNKKEKKALLKSVGLHEIVQSCFCLTH